MLTKYIYQSKIDVLAESDLSVYIYEDIFDKNLFFQIKNLVVGYYKKNDTKSLNTHGTIFNYNNKLNKIISHSQNAREQHVIFDFTTHEEYRYQTHDTVKYWARHLLSTTVSPIFTKAIHILETSEPFCANPDEWLPYRMHLNVLSYEKWLEIHTDGGPHLWQCNNFEVPARSVTVYLDELSLGGKFWTLNGFSYKPKANTAININGNQVMHGVSQNLDSSKKTRYAFTIRFAPISYLLLPGHPDKFLYKNYDNSNSI